MWILTYQRVKIMPVLQQWGNPCLCLNLQSCCCGWAQWRCSSVRNLSDINQHSAAVQTPKVSSKCSIHPAAGSVSRCCCCCCCCQGSVIPLNASTPSDARVSAAEATFVPEWSVLTSTPRLKQREDPNSYVFFGHQKCDLFLDKTSVLSIYLIPCLI